MIYYIILYVYRKLNIMWKYIASLNKAILNIPNNPRNDTYYSDEMH